MIMMMRTRIRMIYIMILISTPVEEDDNDSEIISANMVFVDVVLTTVMLFAIYDVVII